jgi:hypothetical protein
MRPVPSRLEPSCSASPDTTAHRCNAGQFSCGRAAPQRVRQLARCLHEHEGLCPARPQLGEPARRSTERCVSICWFHRASGQRIQREAQLRTFYCASSPRRGLVRFSGFASRGYCLLTALSWRRVLEARRSDLKETLWFLPSAMIMPRWRRFATQSSLSECARELSRGELAEAPLTATFARGERSRKAPVRCADLTRVAAHPARTQNTQSSRPLAAAAGAPFCPSTNPAQELSAGRSNRTLSVVLTDLFLHHFERLFEELRIWTLKGLIRRELAAVQSPQSVSGLETVLVRCQSTGCRP